MLAHGASDLHQIFVDNLEYPDSSSISIIGLPHL